MATTLTCNQGNRVSAEPCISQMTECPFLRYSTEHQFLMHPGSQHRQQGQQHYPVNTRELISDYSLFKKKETFII